MDAAPITAGEALKYPSEQRASHAQQPRKPSFSERRHVQRLQDAIHNVSKRLFDLAKLGHAGQWVLHQQDLYWDYIDTRPHSRTPGEQVSIRDLTVAGIPLHDRALVWGGKGPPPDFLDAEYWEAKGRDLQAKIAQVKNGSIRPGFAPEELQTLEELKNQEGNYYYRRWHDKLAQMQDDKCLCFGRLLGLADLGRPGQWILHREDLYNPAFDTRPQTRAPGRGIVITNFMYDKSEPLPRRKKKIVNEAVWGSGIPIRCELIWDGPGLPPDLEDPDYWEAKAADLLAKSTRAKDGLVEPAFTPEELRVLESLEQQDDHIFGEVARTAPPPPTPPPVEWTAEARDIAHAKSFVRDLLVRFWDHGLAGKWVLYNEPFYVEGYDIRVSDRDQSRGDGGKDDGDGGSTEDSRVVLSRSWGEALYYDGEPLPEFDTVAYWEAKLAELEKKMEDVKAGKVEHRFAPSDLMRIQLVEMAAKQAMEAYDSDSARATPERHAIKSWLNGHSYDAADPHRPATPPRSPVPSMPPTPPFPAWVRLAASDEPPAIPSVQDKPVAKGQRGVTQKRKRSPRDDGDEGDNNSDDNGNREKEEERPPARGHAASRGRKRSKTQPQQPDPVPAVVQPGRRASTRKTRAAAPPTPVQTAPSAQPQRPRGRPSRAAASAQVPAETRPGGKTPKRHGTAPRRGTRKAAAGPAERGGRAAKRQAGGDGPPTTKDVPLRRSARLAAQPAKKYT